LLYGSECTEWTLTLRKYGVSNIHGKLLYRIFFISVRNVRNYVTDVSLDSILLNMRMRFISGLCYVNNSSLQFIFNVTAKQVLIQVIELMGLGRNKVGLLDKLWCDICITLY